MPNPKKVTDKNSVREELPEAFQNDDAEKAMPDVKKEAAPKSFKKKTAPKEKSGLKEPRNKKAPAGEKNKEGTDFKSVIKKKDEKLALERLLEKKVSVQKNGKAKAIFITCMCLLFPIALLIVLAVIALFLGVLAVLIVIAGVLSLSLAVIDLVGIVMSLAGVTYGSINLITGHGFELCIGQYELGLGLAIAGIAIIFTGLLYSCITGLLPFLMKKLGILFKYLCIKVVKYIKLLYKYSTEF